MLGGLITAFEVMQTIPDLRQNTILTGKMDNNG